jgi:hypothetical protein
VSDLVVSSYLSTISGHQNTTLQDSTVNPSNRPPTQGKNMQDKPASKHTVGLLARLMYHSPYPWRSVTVGVMKEVFLARKQHKLPNVVDSEDLTFRKVRGFG